MLSTKAGKAVSTESQFDMQMKLNLITKHATEDVYTQWEHVSEY